MRERGMHLFEKKNARVLPSNKLQRLPISTLISFFFKYNRSTIYITLSLIGRNKSF